MARTAVISRHAPAESPFEAFTSRRALRAATVRLSEAGVDSPGLTAEVLLRHVLGLDQSELYLRLDDPLRAEHRQGFEKLLDRRVRHEPVAYVTGKKEFWSLEFNVNGAVLIPRPETESLVELALDYAREIHSAQPIRIADIGTGSGAIAVSLAKNLPEAEIWAVDISNEALSVAEGNAIRHHVMGRIHLLKGDLIDALGKGRAPFNMIVSNPPYIRRGELASLAPEIREWEPLTALDGGEDGFEFYRRIIPSAQDYLNDGGRVLLEIGSDMAAGVVDLFARAGCYAPATVCQDYAGRDRVVAAMKGTRRG